MAFQLPFKFGGSSDDAAIAARARPSRMMEYDQPLVWVVVLLMLFGMVMVYSASIALPDSPKFAYLGGKNNYFLLRQAMFIAVSLLFGLFAFRIPVAVWQRFAPLMFVVTLIMLAIVLVPGVGVSVNGCSRPRS
jgi:cell division protein FtsW